MLELFNALLENCKVASCLFLFLLLCRPITEKFFSQSWHYLALRVNLLLFFLPIGWFFEKIAPFLVKKFPIKTIEEVTEQVIHQVEFVPYLATYTEKQATEQFTTTINWSEILVSTCFVVGLCIFVWQLYCIIRLHREVKGLSTVKCPMIQKLFKKCKENMGENITLLESETIYSPVLLGLCHPKILLPVKKMQEQHLEYIFAHELTHLRRNDLWWKALLTPLTILYWWNPLIYIFNAQFETVLEYSCDEEVVKFRSREERKCYGKAILESIDERQTNPVLGVSFRTPEQLLETRLKKMLKFNEMKTKTKVLSGILMSAMLLGAVAPSMITEATGAKELLKAEQTISENTVVYVITTVSLEDREIFTDDEWQVIMQRVENKEVLLFETKTEEIAYLNENYLTFVPSIVEQNTIIMEGTQNSEDFDEILAQNPNIQSFEFKIVAVSPSDEDKFTPEEWADILEKVETGEIQMIEQEGIQIDNTEVLDIWSNEDKTVESNESTLNSVNKDDESFFSAEYWTTILAKVESGDILMFETFEAEEAYWESIRGNNSTDEASIVERHVVDAQIVLD